MAATGPPAVAVVTAARVRHHATPRAGHQAHVVATWPDARLQGPSTKNHGPGNRTRTGRLGRGPGHNLQPGGARSRARAGRRHSDAVHRRRARQDRRAAFVRVITARRPAARSPRR